MVGERVRCGGCREKVSSQDSCREDVTHGRDTWCKNYLQGVPGRS